MESTTVRFHTQEVNFEIPAQWQDQTVNIFTSAAEVFNNLSLVITREKAPKDESLADFAQRHLQQLAKKMPQFTVRHARAAEVARSSAFDAEFTWRSDRGVIHQRQVYVALDNLVL